MKDVRSRSEIEAQERDLSQETDEHLENEQEEASQLEQLQRTLADLNDCGTAEGSEKMNTIVQDIGNKGTERIEKAQEEVEDGAETEKQEVSDPSDQAGDEALLDAGRLEGAAMMIDRYADDLHGAMKEKDDESQFFTEVSDRSKDHQETDKKEANDVAQDARNTLNSLREF